jgi:UDP-glucose 4-epimerase
MNVLVTGGSGFLGGRLVQHLALTVPEGSIRLGSRRRMPPPSWAPDVLMATTHWNSPKQLDEICCGVEAVVHLAGMNAQDCAADPAGAMHTNAVSTGQLLQAAIRQGVERFVYLSTAHVYGNPMMGRISEQVCPNSLHPYAFSHRAGEDLVRAAHQEGKITGVVLRLSNAYGAPTQVEANCWMLLMNDLCRQAVVTGQMILASSGRQTRDFITLTDACRAVAHFLALPRDQIGDGLFNVGGAHTVSVLAFAQILRERVTLKLGAEVDLCVQPHPSGLVFPEFDYSIEKLLKTGFVLDANHLRELDGLLDFCIRHFGKNGKEGRKN